MAPFAQFVGSTAQWKLQLPSSPALALWTRYAIVLCYMFCSSVCTVANGLQPLCGQGSWFLGSTVLLLRLRYSGKLVSLCLHIHSLTVANLWCQFPMRGFGGNETLTSCFLFAVYRCGRFLYRHNGFRRSPPGSLIHALLLCSGSRSRS